MIGAVSLSAMAGFTAEAPLLNLTCDVQIPARVTYGGMKGRWQSIPIVYDLVGTVAPPSGVSAATPSAVRS